MTPGSFRDMSLNLAGRSPGPSPGNRGQGWCPEVTSQDQKVWEAGLNLLQTRLPAGQEGARVRYWDGQSGFLKGGWATHTAITGSCAQ